MQAATYARPRTTRISMLLGLMIVAIIGAGCEKAPRPPGESRPFPGYTLIQQLTFRTTDLVDMEGRTVHRWTSRHPLAAGARLLPNGDLIRSGFFEKGTFAGFAPGLSGIIERFDWDGNLLWSFTYSEPRKTIHHDLEVLPNGNILLTGIELKDKEQQLDAGRDPARMRGDTIWIDYLIEIKPSGRSGGEVVWQWNAWDHLVQDYDPARKNYGVVSEHPELIDVNFIETRVPISGSRMQLVQSIGYVAGQKAGLPTAPPMPDWTHVNAISYNASLDQILLTVRSLGEVWVIDHSTTTAQAAGRAGGRSGKGGGLLYRWGNPQAYQCGKPSDQKLFGPHDAQWIAPGLPGAGNVLIFNNGDGRRDGNYSSIEEIEPPVSSDGSYKIADGKAQAPATALWSYVAEPKNSFCSLFLSGVQRLPNGNTLICSGSEGNVFEVDPAGRTLWRYTTNAKMNSSSSPGGIHPNLQLPAGPSGLPRPPGGPGEGPFPHFPLISVLDTNGDGVIDEDELAQAAASLKKLDANADGRIAIEECLPIPNGGHEGIPGPDGPPSGVGGPPGGPGGPPGGPPPLPPIFTALDTNGDLALDSEELARATSSLKKCDMNKDGKITIDESMLHGPMGSGLPQGPGGVLPGLPGGPKPGPGGPPTPVDPDAPISGGGAGPGLFRAVRFGVDYPPFKGRTLTPLPER